MSSPDAVRRRQIAALAADESWAQTPDWRSRTAPARQAQWKKYESQADPARQLDPATRAKSAEKVFKAHQRRRSRKGVLVRRREKCHELAGGYVQVVTETGETFRGLLLPLNANDEIRLEMPDGSLSDLMPISRIASLQKAKVPRDQRRPAA